MIYQREELSGEINSKLWEVHKIKEKISKNFSIKAREERLAIFQTYCYNNKQTFLKGGFYCESSVIS